jgi:hypothetical protein
VLAPAFHDRDAVAAEHLIEGAAVLAVAVADQDADALLGAVQAEVARLLGDPRPGRVARTAGKPDAAARVRDKEEHVVAAQKQLSTVKKSQATMLAACSRTNSRQFGPVRRGAGPSLARASRRRTLVGETRKPNLPSSPQILR